MRTCATCGNEIPDRAGRCPFCERTQPPQPGRPRRRGSVHVVDLKQGMPIVADAMRQLELQLNSIRTSGGGVARIVHGWGSTGRGGAIRTATHRRLRELQGRGLLRAVVPGEAWTEFDADARELLQRHPALAETLQSDRLNRGITIVEV
jgi:hypothetical protein